MQSPSIPLIDLYLQGIDPTFDPAGIELHDDVPHRTCLVRVGDAMLATRFANYRVWMSNDVLSTFTSRPNLSNELMDCTFVYNDTEVFYLVTAFYSPAHEKGLRWDDPAFGINWPQKENLVISEKDQNWPDYILPKPS